MPKLPSRKPSRNFFGSHSETDLSKGLSHSQAAAARRVSFDDFPTSSDDTDVTTRFLTSSSCQHSCCSPSANTSASPLTLSKKAAHKHGLTSKQTLTRLSRSGCLNLLEEQRTTTERKRKTIQSVSEDDMAWKDEVTAESYSGSCSIHQPLDHHSRKGCDANFPGHEDWGQYVDFLPSTEPLPKKRRFLRCDHSHQRELSHCNKTPKRQLSTPNMRAKGEYTRSHAVHSPTYEISVAMKRISL